jgi:hypothetical protein
VNGREREAYLYWLKDIQTLAALAYNWDRAASARERDKWKTAVQLQLKTINWRAQNFPVQPIPVQFPVCQDGIVTQEYLLDVLKKMFE